jgi:hypothetical protein
MDLMEMIKGSINNQVMGQIGTALGTDSQNASKAVGSALPAILGGLVKQASNPQSASSLFNMLDKVDPSMLDNLGGALSGGKAQSMIEMGNKMLPSIFGSNFSSIFGVLGKLTGLGQGKIGPLLGMLIPIVMGVLAKAKKTSGMDAAGFTKLLMDQKQHLTGLDSGLTDQLGIGNLMGSGKQAMETVGKSVQRGADVARDMASAGGGSIVRWLIPILGLVAIGVALWIIRGRDAGETTLPKNGGGGTVAGGAAVPGAESAVNPTKGITDFLTDAAGALTDIKDEAGAKAVAEKLQGLTSKVDSLGLDKLSGITKGTIGTAIKAFLDKAQAWAAKAYEIPGAKAILEPVVNGLVDKLKGFAG